MKMNRLAAALALSLLLVLTMVSSMTVKNKLNFDQHPQKSVAVAFNGTSNSTLQATQIVPDVGTTAERAEYMSPIAVSEDKTIVESCAPSNTGKLKRSMARHSRTDPPNLYKNLDAANNDTAGTSSMRI
jgi:hypothetical protein